MGLFDLFKGEKREESVVQPLDPVVSKRLDEVTSVSSLPEALQPGVYLGSVVEARVAAAKKLQNEFTEAELPLMSRLAEIGRAQPLDDPNTMEGSAIVANFGFKDFTNSTSY